MRCTQLLTALLMFLAAGWFTRDSSAADRPNVVVILADDLGWGDLACYGHPLIKTPHLDAFVKQGLRLTQCYSACAVCSPSRSSIVTGRTPYRNGVFNWIPEGSHVHLRPSEITSAKLLKQSGYATCHVGKWHLNGLFNKPEQPQPSDHGYDWWLATQNNAAPSHRHPTNFVRNGQPIGEVQAYSAPFVASEAIRWLRDERDKSKPFFLAMWTHEPHYPIASAPEFEVQYPDLTDPVQRAHHANVTQMDFAAGQLLKALDELKLADNTIVFFTSDNGPEGNGVTTPGRGSTGGLRGRKRSVYEGGIRVPGIVRWPGHVAAGTTSDVPVIGSDIFVTCCEIAGVALPKDRVLDGGSLLPLFRGEANVSRSRPLYWRCAIAPEPLKVALRIGDWKLVCDEKLATFELYNVERDPQEKQELSQQEPAKLAELKSAVERMHLEIEQESPGWHREPPSPLTGQPVPKATKKKKQANQ
jgi:arylsulfatase A